MRVAVVGAGIAGLTAALRLSERGYDVTLYEEQDVLGGNLSSRRVNGVYHDVYPHMFCDWYANFWNIFESDLGLQRSAHFEARTGVKLLRKGEDDYVHLNNTTSLQALWGNLRSGVLPVPDTFLLGYSLLDLASQPLHKRELLNRLSVNGFLHSRPYATERCAEMIDLLLMEIWSIHGDLTSAAAYKHFTKHTFSFPRAAPFAWLLKGSLQEKVIGPLQRKLESVGCDIRPGSRVEAVRMVDRKFEIAAKGQRRSQVDHVVLALPPTALAQLVGEGENGTRIVDRLPELSQLRRLRAEPIAVLDLYFKSKLPGIPKEHVALGGCDYDLTFLDISQLWTDDPNMRDRTALVLGASDFYALPSDSPEESGYVMIRKLHEYLPMFDPGKRWGDPKSDVLWKKSLFQTNLSRKVFVNEVGCEEWQPSPSYEALPGLFFAGDFCRNDVDMASIEAAVLSGLHAAEALWNQAPLGDPIPIAEHDVNSDATLLAMKLGWTPFAYWAKAWSTALDALPALARGDVGKVVGCAAGMLSLPYSYTMDWWQTAFAFWDHLLFEGRRSRKLR